MADIVPPLDVITEATNRMMLEQRRAENDVIARTILDAISGYNALHAEVTGSCIDIFSDAPCRIDNWPVRRVASYG